MRILYVCHHRREPMGGAARASSMLADAMRQRGHEVTLLFSDDFSPNYQSERLRQLLLPVVLGRKTKLIRELKPDILDISGGYGARLFRSLQGESVLRVVRSYGLEEAEWGETLEDAALGRIELRRRARLFRGWWQIEQVQKSCARADLFIGPTRASIKTVCEKHPGLRACNTGLGVESEIFNLPLNPPLNAFRILFIGTWIPRKGYRDFAEACRPVMETNDSVEVAILGSEVSASEVHSSFPGHLHERIKVHGRLSRGEQLRVMRSCSICVCTSVYEGFGLANLEALALGLPLISTETGILADVKEDGMVSIVPKRSPKHVTALLREAQGKANIHDDALARRNWAKSHTWEVVAARTEAAYAEALAAHRGRV